MLIRSIYGETPEGAVPVEDRGPNKTFRQAKQVGVGPQQEKCESISPNKASWAFADRLSKESHRTKQVGGG